VSRRPGASALPFLLAAAGRAQDTLAQAEALGGHLDELVRRDVLDRALERELGRWRQLDALALALGAEVRELLCPHGVDGDVLVPGVLAHDHPLVDLLAGADEELAALLDAVERVGGRHAGLGREDGAGEPREHLARVGPVLLEEMAHDAPPVGRVDDVDLEADQPARRDGGLDHREWESFSMLVITPLRLARFWTIAPTHSSGTSIQTVS